MISITQLQEYLHLNAQQQYEAVKIPYSTLYFHPSEALTFFNYGIPNVTEVEQAFEHGAEVVFLTAADEQSGRVYQTVGFENYTIVLPYVDSDDNSG